MKGIIETATGDLLRAGFVNFTPGAGESLRTDVPDSPFPRGKYNPFHRWNGSSWDEVEDLAISRSLRYAEIDVRTGELIEEGFTWNSKVFALDTSARNTWLGLYVAVKHTLLTTFPIGVSLLNNENYDFADATEVEDFFATGAGTVKSHMESGKDLKASISAATTQAAIDAVVDTR